MYLKLHTHIHLQANMYKYRSTAFICELQYVNNGLGPDGHALYLISIIS